jgi:hypothetical protein
MMRAMIGRWVAVLGIGSLLAGCSGNVGSTSTDSGVAIDAALPKDVGFVDGATDAGPTDTTRADVDPIMDASVVDTGPEDTGPLPPGCAGRNYKLCEDFEGAPIDGVPTDWRRVMPYTPEPGAANATEVLVTADQPHWGTKSLKSTSESCGQTRIEHDLTSLGATAGRHWGRAWFYVDTPAPMSNQNGGWYHTTMVGLRGDNSGGGNARECRVVDMVENAFDQSVAFLYNVPDDSCCSSTEVNDYDYRYEEVWHCAEWFVDASTNSYRFFLDGTELFSFENNAGSRLPQCEVSIAVGTVCYAPPVNAPQRFTSWIDDVALDDDRIGCQ